MKRIASLFLAVLTAAAIAGCNLPAATAEVLKSDRPRDTSPAVDFSSQKDTVAGNGAFALRLYHELAQDKGNIFFSPYSISEALAMTYAGARGQTETDMSKALSFSLPQDRLHPAFNWLDLELGKRGEEAKGQDGKGFRLHVVNALWGQKDYEFQTPFLDTLAVNYGAGMRVADFIKESEASRLTINAWVEEQTEKRIKDLVPPGAINELTRLVLTNAIYFNAAWLRPFDEKRTTDGVFHRLDGSTVTVPMMRQTGSFRYGEGAGFQAVEMLYDGNELSMIILLPSDGQLGAFEDKLDYVRVTEILASLKQNQVQLSMPRFENNSSFSLKQALSALGMGVAFTQLADFSGMNGKRDLLIQDVVHKAFVSVDEAGTEAAAATAVIVGTTSMPPEPVEMAVDSPFVYLVRDNATGSLLFVGRVADPGK